MNEFLKQGTELLRQKHYRQAEPLLQQAAKEPSSMADALVALVQLALVQKKYILAVEWLDQLMEADPNNLWAEVTLVHLRSRNGPLINYQASISNILNRIQNKPLQSVQAGSKFLRSIHYSVAGNQRIKFLHILLECTKQAIANKNKPTIGFKILRANIFFALQDYTNLSRSVEQLSKLNSPPPALRTLQKVVKRYQSPEFPDYLAPKVFGIGLSRTATSSLNSALKILGYESIHWINNHTQNLISEVDFLLFDGFTDINVSYQFEQLYHTFPRSRFIYTNRSLDLWIKSITTHYYNTRLISSPGELTQTHLAKRFDGNAGIVEWDLYAQYPTWEIAYNRFHERVCRFFADKPNDRFLELRITEGDGWEKLCTFLEKPVPEISFPHDNQGLAHYQTIA